MIDSDNRNLKVAELAHSEAVRGLSGQESSLQSIRQRATANIAITGIAASFLGSEVISITYKTAFAELLMFLAMLVFLASIGTSIRVLQSRKGWVFHQSAKQIQQTYMKDHPEMTQDQVVFTVAGHLEESYQENKSKLDRLYSTMNLAFGLTVGHIIIWILAVTISTWSAPMSQQQQPQTNSPEQPVHNEPAAVPEPPQQIPNPGVEEQRSDVPTQEPPVHITPEKNE